MARPQYTLEKLEEIHTLDSHRITKTESMLLDLARTIKRHTGKSPTLEDMRSIRSIQRHAITLHRLYEAECNGCTRDRLPGESWAQYDAARELQMQWVEKRIKDEERLIHKHALNLGLKLYFQTDPRGCPVYLSTKYLTDQNYHSEGVGVSTYGY